jgi:hypothetical protein
MSEHVAGACGRCPWCGGLAGIEPHVELKALQAKTGQMGVSVLFVQFLPVIARRAPSSKDFLCCNISSKHAFIKPLINKRF